MLSGLKIKEEIKKGNIVISDFNEKQLNPNSYNIRLGNKLKVYKKTTIPMDVIYNEINQGMEPYKEEYMKICDELADPKFLEENIEGANDRRNRLVEIAKAKETLTDTVMKKYALNPKKENETIDIEIPEDGYVLIPGTLYLGETVEYTETYGFIPNIDGRSTTGRLGIEIHRTAGFGDNGFKGKWTLEITATHPVIVYPNMEIGQLYYETIDGDDSIKYEGKYQNQEGVQAAKVDR